MPSPSLSPLAAERARDAALRRARTDLPEAARCGPTRDSSLTSDLLPVGALRPVMTPTGFADAVVAARPAGSLEPVLHG